MPTPFAPLVVLTGIAGEHQRATPADVFQQRLRMGITDAFLSSQDYSCISFHMLELLLKQEIKRNFVLNEHLLHQRGRHVGSIDAVSHRRPITHYSDIGYIRRAGVVAVIVFTKKLK